MALALRGLALFLGAFTLIGLIGELRGRTTDLSLWWVDLRDLPGVLRIALLTAFSGLLVAWAVRAAPGLRLRRATALACAGFALLAVRDSARFVAASGSGLVHSTLPVPFSLFVAATLAVSQSQRCALQWRATAGAFGQASQSLRRSLLGASRFRWPRCSSSGRRTTDGPLMLR